MSAKDSLSFLFLSFFLFFFFFLPFFFQNRPPKQDDTDNDQTNTDTKDQAYRENPLKVLRKGVFFESKKKQKKNKKNPSASASDLSYVFAPTSSFHHYHPHAQVQLFRQSTNYSRVLTFFFIPSYPAGFRVAFRPPDSTRLYNLIFIFQSKTIQTQSPGPTRRIECRRSPAERPRGKS
jgi:hypothetical protein